jgi:hypothetical protein
MCVSNASCFVNVNVNVNVNTITTAIEIVVVVMSAIVKCFTQLNSKFLAYVGLSQGYFAFVAGLRIPR